MKNWQFQYLNDLTWQSPEGLGRGVLKVGFYSKYKVVMNFVIMNQLYSILCECIFNGTSNLIISYIHISYN